MATIFIYIGGWMIKVGENSYRITSRQSGTRSISEMVLFDADGLKTDAPIEPKTGDIYFSQAKLMLPSNPELQSLRYSYDHDSSELSLSSQQVYRQTAAKLYGANNLKELFDVIPKLQACERGISLGYKQIEGSDTTRELVQTVKLNSGKTLYVYLEKGCPELNDTAKIMVNVREY